MELKFDWTINIGTLLVLLTFLGGGFQFYMMVRDKLRRIDWLTTEFNPHFHNERGDGTPLTTAGIVKAKIGGK